MMTSVEQQKKRRSERLIEEYILHVCNVLSVIFVPRNLIAESDVEGLVNEYFQSLGSDVRDVVIHDDILNTCVNILNLERSIIVELDGPYSEALVDMGLVLEEIPSVSPEFDAGNYEPSLNFMGSEVSADNLVVGRDSLLSPDHGSVSDSDDNFLSPDLLISSYLDEIGSLKSKVDELTEDNSRQSSWIDDADGFLDDIDDLLSDLEDSNIKERQIESIKYSIKSLRIDKPF